MVTYYELSTPVEKEQRDGTKKTFWTKVGVAFPLKNQDGFSIDLSALPVNGKLIMKLPFKKDEYSEHNKAKQDGYAPAMPELGLPAVDDSEIPF